MDYYSFFFNDTATTEIYTLSLHDALPICTAGAFELHFEFEADTQPLKVAVVLRGARSDKYGNLPITPVCIDRKSTRLNSSHANISYAVFCLKKKSHTSLLACTAPWSSPQR